MAQVKTHLAEMGKNMDIQTVGFIGFGLIGGSIARGIRKQKPDTALIAYNYYENRENPRLSSAKSDGILDEIYTDITELSNCDILFLCAPVCSNIAYLEQLKDCLSKDCILTDVGSVKGSIHHAVERLGLTRQFIGGHPMAGSEKTGYDNSSSALLQNAYYILTPTKETPLETIALMEELVKMLGAIPVQLDAAHHDDITAAISHVPHVLSSTLVHMVLGQEYEEQMCKLSAGSFRDMTRVAASSPVMWQDICLTNADSILHFLEVYKEKLSLFEEALRNKDADALLEAFSQAKTFRDLYHKAKKNAPPSAEH